MEVMEPMVDQVFITEMSIYIFQHDMLPCHQLPIMKRIETTCNKLVFSFLSYSYYL